MNWEDLWSLLKEPAVVYQHHRSNQLVLESVTKLKSGRKKKDGKKKEINKATLRLSSMKYHVHCMPIVCGYVQ